MEAWIKYPIGPTKYCLYTWAGKSFIMIGFRSTTINSYFVYEFLCKRKFGLSQN